MIRLFILFIMIFLVAGCGTRPDNFVQELNDFGIKSAKMGLWNEAVMRWEQIVELDPKNARAHNNLGVAYETKGELDAAMKEYKIAIELEPNNSVYLSNYIKFKKNYERVNKKTKD